MFIWGCVPGVLDRRSINYSLVAGPKSGAGAVQKYDQTCALLSRMLMRIASGAEICSETDWGGPSASARGRARCAMRSWTHKLPRRTARMGGEMPPTDLKEHLCEFPLETSQDQAKATFGEGITQDLRHAGPRGSR